MTLKEIAKIAGVSIATVSYALHDSDKVSDEVKEKIRRIAKEYNYQPDRRAQALRTGRARLLGILTEDISFVFTARIIQGIYKFAEENNYHVVLSDTCLKEKVGSHYENTVNYKDDINKKLDFLLSCHVDGIIYVGSHDRDISGIVKTNKPIVYTYCFTDSPDDYMILYENTKSAYEVTNYLIANGHKRIGLIRGTETSNPSNERFLGYQMALMEARIPLDLTYVKTGDWNFDKGEEAAMELLSLENRPTAIFALNDYMALGVLEAADKLGIKVPEELSVVGYDNTDMCSFVKPRLSSVALPVEEMGYLSAKMVHELCTRPEKIEAKKLTLPCSFIERGSVVKNKCI